MRRARIQHPPADWLDEFKTEPKQHGSARPAPHSETDEEALKVIDVHDDEDMPIKDDWFSYFSDNEPEAPSGTRLLAETDQRMWPAVAPLPAAPEIKRPPTAWEELEEFARTTANDWPRGSRTAIALATLSIVALALVGGFWFLQNRGASEPDATLSSAASQGSDRGQTGVRPGSDLGQTGVRPGSDTDQAPPAASALNSTAAPPITPPSRALATPTPAPRSSPKPTPAPTPPAARATPTPTPTPSVTPVPTRTPAAPPPLTGGTASGSSSQVLAAGAAGSSALPPAPAKPAPPVPTSTAPPARVLSVPPATTAADGSLPSPPPDATEAAKVAISGLLEGYRNGHSTLNARAVRNVWPGVNEPALARAFEQMEAQNMSYSSCGIEVKGLFAQAHCVGEVAFVPKVGSRTPRVEVRRWTFELRRVNDAWRIDRVTTR